VNPSTLNLLGVGAFVVLFVLCAVFLRIVRQHHPDVWRELGCPTIFKNQDTRTSIRAMRYFLNRGYRSVSDRRFVLFCDVFLVIEVVILASVVYFVVSNIVFFAQLVLRRKPSNQSMKPTALWRYNLSVFATTPCHGLSLSR
jgi:hypothetical protein